MKLYSPSAASLAKDADFKAVQELAHTAYLHWLEECRQHFMLPPEMMQWDATANERVGTRPFTRDMVRYLRVRRTHVRDNRAESPIGGTSGGGAP